MRSALVFWLAASVLIVNLAACGDDSTEAQPAADTAPNDSGNDVAVDTQPAGDSVADTQQAADTDDAMPDLAVDTAEPPIDTAPDTVEPEDTIGDANDVPAPEDLVDTNQPPADTAGPKEPPPELVAWYRFESPNEELVHDKSIYGHHGTASEGVQRGVKGRYGFGVRFDGDKSNIDIPFTEALNITGPITIEVWVFLDTPVSNNRMLVRKILQYQLSISVTPEPNLMEFYSQPLGFAHSQTPVDFAQWMYLAVTHDGQTARFYLNGELESKQAFGGQKPSKTSPLKLGSDGFNKNAPDGGMDEVKVWSVVRTEQEICEDGYGTFDPGAQPKCTFPESINQP